MNRLLLVVIAVFVLLAQDVAITFAEPSSDPDGPADHDHWCYYSPLYPIQVGPETGGFGAVHINNDCSYTVNGETFAYEMPPGYGLMDRVLPTWLEIRVGITLGQKHPALPPVEPNDQARTTRVAALEQPT